MFMKNTMNEVISLLANKCPFCEREMLLHRSISNNKYYCRHSNESRIYILFKNNVFCLGAHYIEYIDPIILVYLSLNQLVIEITFKNNELSINYCDNKDNLKIENLIFMDFVNIASSHIPQNFDFLDKQSYLNLANNYIKLISLL